MRIHLLLLVVLALAGPAAAQKVVQPTYATPEEAFKALVAAARADDTESLLAILGPGSRPMLESGDPVADRNLRTDFVKAADERTFYVHTSPTRVEVNIGFDNFPMAVPLVKKGEVWRFDTQAGLQEMLDRRIGRNELAVIEACRAIVDAQRRYYLEDMDGNGVMDYAARVMSTPNTRDGLYWPATQDSRQSPLGPLIARATEEGYGPAPEARAPKARTTQSGAPYHGYYFRILREQGRNARGGAFRYGANGNLVAGFAVLAWPAEYGNSGLTTFQVNANGAIWQKDLGPDTDAWCRAATAYNPDSTWTKLK